MINAFDGSGLTNITHNGTDDVYGLYSPDGTKMVFASDREGAFDIYVMNADWTNITNLTNSIKSEDRHPKLSHDGTKIVFDSQRDGPTEIYIMNADGSNQTRLTSNSVIDTEPALSPF